MHSGVRRTRRQRALRWPLLLILFTPLKCVAPSRQVAATPQRACLVGGTSSTAALDSVTVAAPGPVDVAHLTDPSNVAERFVFAQSYETLMRVDCDGQPYPALARSWTIDASKTRITLVLRDDAHFWDGTQIRAGDVIAAWRSTGSDDTASGRLARRFADAATIVDDRTLLVSLPDTAWRALADPALSIYRSSMGWPEGSGPYRIEDVPGRGVLRMTPTAQRWPRLVIRASPGADARDAIDAGADVVLTGDRAAVEYAATRPELETVPLPWDRTYLFVVPDSARRAAIAPVALLGDSANAFRASLVRDVVRAEARPAEPPYWWDAIPRCISNGSFENADARAATRGRASRVAYRADDHVARELADRFVALVPRAVSAPMSAPDFARALSTGSDLAYVVALPRESLAPCWSVAQLLSSAPWIARAAEAGALIPAVDTRTRAIVRRDHAALAVDWDGTLRIAGSTAHQ